MTPVCNMWCSYMLRYITAQPFHEVLFSFCSSRAVLTKQIITQSCLIMLGWVLVHHNHAKISVVLFTHPPSLCSWHSCAVQGRYLHISVCAVGGLSHSFRWEFQCWLGSGWLGNATSPSHCRKWGDNSGLNSWLVNKAV